MRGLGLPRKERKLLDPSFFTKCMVGTGFPSEHMVIMIYNPSNISSVAYFQYLMANLIIKKKDGCYILLFWSGYDFYCEFDPVPVNLNPDPKTGRFYGRSGKTKYILQKTTDIRPCHYFVRALVEYFYFLYSALIQIWTGPLYGDFKDIP